MLCGIPKGYDPNLLVGYGNSDDAAVYKIDENKVMVQTVDVFPPMVDDPFIFGEIAACNSLSDVYAMGAEPNLCMNILAYPKNMELQYVKNILEGGYSKVNEANAVIAGGHTLNDDEPKYGLSVTGITDINKVLRNDAAKEGDLLILTKPLGNGIINNAYKAGKVEFKYMENAIKFMRMLNKYAYDVMKKYKVNSCTDITGFGLLGHSYEMASGSNKSIEIFSKEVPLLNGVLDAAVKENLPGGTFRNIKYVGEDISISPTVSENLINVLFNPETSGGLLISLPEKNALELQKNLKDSVEYAEIVGQVKEKNDKAINIY